MKTHVHTQKETKGPLHQVLEGQVCAQSNSNKYSRNICTCATTDFKGTNTVCETTLSSFEALT